MASSPGGDRLYARLPVARLSLDFKSACLPARPPAASPVRARARARMVTGARASARVRSESGRTGDLRYIQAAVERFSGKVRLRLTMKLADIYFMIGVCPAAKDTCTHARARARAHHNIEGPECHKARRSLGPLNRASSGRNLEPGQLGPQP